MAQGGADFTAPFDAVIGPGNVVYFSAYAVSDGNPYVFTVTPPSTAVAALSASTSLSAPVSLAISSGLASPTLFIADPGSDASSADRGAVLALPASGGAAVLVSGTEGYTPTAVAYVPGSGGSADQLYFAGFDAAHGLWGVFAVAPSGGSVSIVVEDLRLTRISGLAVDAAGHPYIVDQDNTTAAVRYFDGSLLTTLASRVHAGLPSGAAISSDGLTLYLAAVDPSTGNNAVAEVSTLNGAVSYVVGSGIDANSEGAGLHLDAAGAVATFVDATGGGTIYVVAP